MKKFLLAITAVVGVATAGSATAADLPVKAAAAPCNCTCDAAQFGGWYLGISGGAAKHIATRTDLDGALEDNASYVTEKWGGIVGGTAGYNWARCRTVWGVEIDGSWAGVKNTLPFNPNGGDHHFIENRMDGFASARLRTGVALDNMMLYVTGGLALARFRTTYFDGADSETDTFKEWRTGWVAGFGTEWAWSPNLTIKSEVLYANFTDRDKTTALIDGGSSFRHSDQVWISRIGVNYKFGYAGVAARY
jgi:outer membrane immunogenic protein